MAHRHNFVVTAALGTSSVQHPRHGQVSVEGMSEKRQLVLWLKGSPHVRITATGAKAHFGFFGMQAQVDLLRHCKDKHECHIIAALQDTATMRAALRLRLEELAPATPGHREEPLPRRRGDLGGSSLPAEAPRNDAPAEKKPRPKHGRKHDTGPDEGAE